MPGEAAAAVASPGADAFLREQAAEAQKALAVGFQELKATLAGAVNPKNVPRKFPVTTIVSAAVAGFAAALLTIPSKEQQELKRLERIRRAMYPDPEPAKTPKGPDEKNGEPASKVPLWMTLVKEGVQAARPILVSLVTASIKSHQQNTPPDGTSPK